MTAVPQTHVYASQIFLQTVSYACLHVLELKLNSLDFQSSINKDSSETRRVGPTIQFHKLRGLKYNRLHVSQNKTSTIWPLILLKFCTTLGKL